MSSPVPAAGPIAVYGATGYTGRLVVAELRRRGADVVLSGRSPGALAALGDANGLPPSAVRPASTDDAAALRRALDGCAAVIACAGPFEEVGDPVVRAAVEAGVHYVDTTGEQVFIRRVLDVHGPAARRAGVALVSGMGFDYLPGDLLCAVAAEKAGRLRDMRITYAVEGFGPTRGTVRSALLMLGGDQVVFEDGALRPAGLRPVTGETSDVPGLGSVPVAAYPSGEHLTVPRHVDTPRVSARITAATFAPHPRLAGAVPVLTPLVTLALRTPLRRGLDRLVGRLPAGPGETARRAAAYTLVAEAHPADGGPVRRAVLRGTDVYGITAVTTSHAALLMAQPGYDRTGGLAPGEAFAARPFLDALAPHGVTYEAP